MEYQEFRDAVKFLSENPRVFSIVYYDREGTYFYIVDRFGSEIRTRFDRSCAVLPHSPLKAWYKRENRVHGEIDLYDAIAHGLPD